MPHGSQQTGYKPSLVTQLVVKCANEMKPHEVATAHIDLPSLATNQHRMLEMEETIRMLVRRNQEMERQFPIEFENLRQHYNQSKKKQKNIFDKAIP